MTASLNSAIYTGTIRHRRFEPFRRDFQYRMFMLLLDLDELDTVFRDRWFWSARRTAPARFLRADHYGPPEEPLDASIRRLILERTGERFDGRVSLLTHLRYFGFYFNPLSLYYCHDAADGTLSHVVAEVSNTPWGERHWYVLPGSGHGLLEARHPKAFHVSPFLGMDLDYRWRLTAPGESLTVHLEDLRGETPVFDATLSMRRKPITGSNLAAAWAAHPWMTGQAVAAIYGQALRLWMRGAPFHAHPGKTSPPAEARLS